MDAVIDSDTSERRARPLDIRGYNGRSLMRVRLILFLAAAGISISQVIPYGAAGAVSFSFVTIATAPTPFSFPAINNNGTAAFTDSTGNFLYVGNGGAVTTLYQSRAF